MNEPKKPDCFASFVWGKLYEERACGGCTYVAACNMESKKPKITITEKRSQREMDLAIQEIIDELIGYMVHEDTMRLKVAKNLLDQLVES